MTSQEFEVACSEYLRAKYSSYGLRFEALGGNDSTKPDIKVYRGDTLICSIEVKEPAAQCGQFVLFPDLVNKKFDYSSRNKPSYPSAASKAIISAMENDFDRYMTPSAKELGLSVDLYSDWIVDYYKGYKSVKYFMTRESVDDGEYIMFPTEKVASYFTLSACYRKKKSGSRNPTPRDMMLLPDIFKRAGYDQYQFIQNGRYTDVILENHSNRTFKIEDDITVQCRYLENNRYRLTCLGTTNNANVIFSINLRSAQDPEDLRHFEDMILSA